MEMTNAGEADKAIAAFNGTDLGGRALTINEAKPKTDRPRSSGGGDGASALAAGAAGAGGTIIVDIRGSRGNRAGSFFWPT